MPPETQEQTEARLLTVIRAAQFEVLDGTYVFEVLSSSDAPMPRALACVRDGDMWAQLVPVVSSGSVEGAFKMFSFHFQEELDASGFVGWLASHLKRTVGTGVIVVCGKDRRGGAALYRASQGVFDYWGCPARIAETVIAEVRSLIACGRGASRELRGGPAPAV